jgi:hypothetical protein
MCLVVRHVLDVSGGGEKVEARNVRSLDDTSPR